MNRKLIIFIASLGSGGAERVVSVLSSLLVNTFLSVEILIYYGEKPYYRIDDRVKISSLEAMAHSKSLLAKIRTLRRYVRQEKPDALLSFLAPFNIMSAFTLIGAKRNMFFAVAQRTDPKHSRYGKSMILRFFRWVTYSFLTDGLVMQTTAAKNYFSKRIQKKCVVIPNPTSVRSEDVGIGLTTQKKHEIVSVGRLIPSKNYEMLFRCFAKVLEKYPDYRLVIYGEGTHRTFLESYIKELGLESSVSLQGRTDNVVEAIKSAELFVFPSNHEGMSNAVIEALCVGLPVVTTDVGGASDMIENGKNGIVIPIGDEDIMISTILNLLYDKDIAKDMAEEATNVAEVLEANAVVSKWAAFLDGGISNK